MKIGIVILSFVLSLFFLLPSILPKDSPVHEYLPGQHLNLGLDLRGGIHVVLGVDTAKALEVEVDHLGSELERRIEEEGIRLASFESLEGERAIELQIVDGPQGEMIEEIVTEDFYQRLSLRWESDTRAIVSLEPEHEDFVEQMSLEQAREIIRSRVDEFGVTEPIIQIEGDDRILVQLPGVSDPQRAIQLIGKTALLEYKLVDEEMNSAELTDWVDSVRAEVGFKNNYTRKELIALNEALSDKLPDNRVISFEKDSEPGSDEVRLTPYLLNEKAVLSGGDLEDARVTTNPNNNRPQVSLTLSKTGAEIFEDVTRENVGTRLAIVLDGTVISAPVINEMIPAISRGATISLGTGPRDQLVSEARDLALVLRSGALPAPVEILENRTVGASLGEDSVEAGKYSGFLAAIIVLIFMLVYYRFSGIVADIAVGLNLMMILAVMAFFQATLTLPGIAGIVLTIGMAVDANVIILERIREELRTKKKLRAAIESGYDAAHKAILDANITTAIAAIVLFNFGSGPIRGFAVTLLIGIICSYITAVWFSRWILEGLVNRMQLKKLSI